jgi:sulfonate transport system substrate-binding protein
VEAPRLLRGLRSPADARVAAPHGGGLRLTHTRLLEKGTKHVKRIIVIFSSLLAVLFVACSSSDSGGKSTPAPTSATPGVSSPSSAEHVTLHLAYFPNLTHAPALIGVARKTLEQELGPNVTLDTKTFNAGPDVVTAIFAGDIDIAYIGPNPSINGYVKSNGDALRVIAGSTSGGALLVVRPGANINSAADLKGKKIATPQLGNTQDVALRNYLKANGLSAPKEGGGDVQVVASSNSDTINLFKQGDVDGAWIPEPYATRLVQEANGKVLVDESKLWPGGKFVTTDVVVRTKFLEDHPDVVKSFLKAHVETIQWINENPDQAKEIANNAIANINSAQPLAQAVVDGAWAHLLFTPDPIASSLIKDANDAYALGFLDSQPDLTRIYALDPLNGVLQEQGLPTVSAQ